MRLITIFELATRNENELRVLFLKVSEELGQADRAAEERANARASLDNIVRAVRSRKELKP